MHVNPHAGTSVTASALAPVGVTSVTEDVLRVLPKRDPASEAAAPAAAPAAWTPPTPQITRTELHFLANAIDRAPGDTLWSQQ